MSLSPARIRVHFLALVGAAAIVCINAATALAIPTPKGSCPQPEHTLVLSEFQVGDTNKPRWLEIANPGKSAVSLDNVVVRVKAKGIAKGSGIAADVLEFAVAEKIASLPAKEVLLVGHLPKTPGGKGPYFGLKLIDLGSKFVLPPCKVKLELIGPAGPIDSFEYDLCKGATTPPASAWQTVMALDQGHLDICVNDQKSNWCIPTAKASLTKPSPGKANPWCDLDGDGYTFTSGDCDDGSKSVNPASVEHCNGVDDDCNSKTDDDVIVPPGVCLSLGICALPGKSGEPVAKCDGANGFTCSYLEGYEAANETKCDGVDNDCDGQTDEALLNNCGTCGTLPVETCNGLDDNCNGATDEGLDLSKHDCGDGICALAKPVCNGADGVSCKLPPQHEKDETRCDGLDNDCDGTTDEGLGLGNACAVGVGACQGVGAWACGNDDKRRCDAKLGAPKEEKCGDGLDNDCDGTTDEGFGVGEQCVAGMGICRVVGKRVCDASAPNGSRCEARPAAAAPAEYCANELDDDCDGLTDEPGCRTKTKTDSTGCGVSARPERSGYPFPYGWLIVAAACLVLLDRQRSPGG